MHFLSYLFDFRLKNDHIKVKAGCRFQQVALHRRDLQSGIDCTEHRRRCVKDPPRFEHVVDGSAGSRHGACLRDAGIGAVEYTLDVVLRNRGDRDDGIHRYCFN